MTIRFAMARSRRRFPYLPWGRTTVALSAANDNTVEMHDPAVLKSALHHFARHGLGAPEAACYKAVQAMEANDEPAFRKWLEMCRTFDRRMAANLARKAARKKAFES